MTARLLVVEDEPDILELLSVSLGHSGFAVLTATSGTAAVQAAQRHRPDLIVLDVMLPDLDGFDVVRRLRSGGDRTPVLYLTARDAVQDRVRGLRLGGDDYVTKPFSLEEVVARIEAVLRRFRDGRAERPARLVFADIELDEDAHEVWRAGEPIPLSPAEFKPPGVDRAALVGWPVAQRLLGFDGHPTTIYERSAGDTVEDVRAVLARTADPRNPEQVTVSRPSDGLAARAFTDLLLGVGAIALLVGGVGVANTMVISVLERRGEIGLRRSLGVTRGQIRLQFLTESLLLSGLGGLAGAAAGAVVTTAYATARDLPPVIPPWALAGGLAATLLIGALAGLYPALRAARLSPTVALTTG
ncbi:response regulator [Actinomadura sp. KC216]|uniref:response regulator n=1 Tax=Actinomadura sp. KC216 TaxID=2530370 RepID=UPI00104FAD57|nr:response regulator [Actinomadura sp. KC216]TDB91111.1 response regulator [Actinomadura sp. KC216]